MNEPQLPCCLNQWKYLAKWQWCVAKCDCLHIYFSEIFQPEIEWTNLNSYSRVGSTQFWYSLSFLLLLHWDDLHMLFSILKSFLALLGRLLMSLPTLPSCLTVLPRYMQLNSSVVGRSSLFTLTSEGFQHHFCLLLADLQAYLLCKHAEIGGFPLHVLMSVCDQCYMEVISEIQIFKGWVEGPVMHHGQSDVVWHITQSIVRLKSNTNIGHPCLTPVFTL